MSTKTASAALYAELDATVPGWRTIFNSLPAAVKKAGERAQTLYEAWGLAFAARSRQAPALKKVDEGSPFDHAAFGMRQSGERFDEPGREDLALSRQQERADADITPPTSGSVRIVTDSGEYFSGHARNEDSLYHPERTIKWSGLPYRWTHRAPRDGSAIRCF